VDDDLQEISSILSQDGQPAYFGMKVLKSSLFVNHSTDSHSRLAAQQAEDFNQQSSDYLAQPLGLFAYLP